MATYFQTSDLLRIVSLFAKAVQTTDEPTLSSSQLWGILGEEIDTTLLPCEDLTVFFHHPREYVRKYEHMLSLFRKLTESLQQATIKHKAMLDTAVRSCGIDKLPAKILSTIFEDAVSTPNDVSALMQVSPRFKSLVMSSPQIWAKCAVDLSTSAGDLSFIVENCRGLPLKATMTSTFTDEADLLAAQRILSCGSSLGQLSIRLPYESVQCVPLMGIQLPVLNELSLQLARIQINGSTLPFYETWELPRLRHLETNFVPPLTLGNTIVSFKCVLESDDRQGEFNQLMWFLISCPVLENLHIRLSNFNASANEARIECPVALPTLRTLSLETLSPNDLHWLVWFLHKVVVDNVSILSLKLEHMHERATDVDLVGAAKRNTPYSIAEILYTHIVSQIAKLPQLRKVRLDIEESRTGMEGGFADYEYQYIWGFNQLLRDLPPSVETFASNSPLVNIQFDRKVPNVDGRRPLLRVNRGKTLTIEQLAVLTQWTGAGGTLLTFIYDCPLIRIDDMAAMFKPGQCVIID